ncbi:hypothetical protein [Oceanobacillus kapialis]|uniref:hypothetical protein n=1 Tax=Oceanobacillus kapialis TaxID=481353 RepID=UPI00384F632C
MNILLTKTAGFLGPTVSTFSKDYNTVDNMVVQDYTRIHKGNMGRVGMVGILHLGKHRKAMVQKPVLLKTE